MSSNLDQWPWFLALVPAHVVLRHLSFCLHPLPRQRGRFLLACPCPAAASLVLLPPLLHPAQRQRPSAGRRPPRNTFCAAGLLRPGEQDEDLPLLPAPVLQRRGLASPCCPCTAALKDELADKQAGVHPLLPSTDSPRPCVPWLASPSSGRRARGRVRRHSCPASEGQGQGWSRGPRATHPGQGALATAALSTSSFSLRQVGGQGPGWELSTCPAAGQNGASRPHFDPFGCAQEAHVGTTSFYTPSVERSGWTLLDHD